MTCTEIPTYNLELYQGDDKTFKFRFKADDVPVDITSYIINLECAEISLSRTAIILDQVTNLGEFEINYLPSDTQELTFSRTKYEMTFTYNGKKQTKMRGTIKLTKEVV